MEKKQAWLYSRIDQEKDLASPMMETHIQQLERYGQNMGFDVVGISKDFGNGYDKKRIGLNEVISAAEQGKFQVLLIISAGRLSRSEELLDELLSTLFENGIQTISIKDGELFQEPAQDLQSIFALGQS